MPSSWKIENARAFLSSKTVWTNLSTVGRTSFARLVILIPLIGYWIIFNRHLQDHISLRWDVGLGNNTASWKLLSAYFGLCFIASGSFLFSLFCPSDTKEYSSAERCSAAKYNFTSDVEFAKIEAFLLDKNPEYVTFEENDCTNLRMSFDNKVEEHQRNKREKRLRLLNMYFVYQDNSRFPLRVAIGILYAVGFVVLSAPALSVFYRVCEELAKSIGG